LHLIEPLAIGQSSIDAFANIARCVNGGAGNINPALATRLVWCVSYLGNELECLLNRDIC